MPPTPHTVSVERRYLALPTPSAFQPRNRAVAPGAVPHLRPLAPTDLAGWRQLYRAVGGPWQWVDRDAWSDTQLAQYLARPAVRVWAVDEATDASSMRASTHKSTHASMHAATHTSTHTATRNIGMVELSAHDDGSVEIVYLGLLPAYHGRGLGAWLLEQAVMLAWQQGANRIWLHTCSLDAPAALPNYLARGFHLERTEHYTVTLPAPTTSSAGGAAAG